VSTTSLRFRCDWKNTFAQKGGRSLSFLLSGASDREIGAAFVGRHQIGGNLEEATTERVD